MLKLQPLQENNKTYTQNKTKHNGAMKTLKAGNKNDPSSLIPKEELTILNTIKMNGRPLCYCPFLACIREGRSLKTTEMLGKPAGTPEARRRAGGREEPGYLSPSHPRHPHLVPVSNKSCFLCGFNAFCPMPQVLLPWAQFLSALITVILVPNVLPRLLL